MPVHIEEMATEVTVLDGELPLTERQVEKLVCKVLERLEEKRRESHRIREATALRRGAAPPSRVGD